ncbi:MAG: OmpA family protein [Bacteroidetes bacterium]|nr:OmpA family protein [Bacteroidota bacterium]MBI3481599.1 OmpA family protein [Bacteroidota bacterium]
MKKTILPSLLFIVSQCLFAQQQDAEGSKDHPMFPNRMSNYLILDYANNFDAVEFNLAANGSKMETKEGNKTSINYGFDNESGKQMPSVLQILRNYENASKKIGGTTLFLNATDEGIAVFKIVKGGKEIWAKVEKGANDALNYVLTIVEVEAMKQEITSNDILTALNTDGYIALYINFDSGKSDIKTESQSLVDQIAEMMKANADLKISIEGHTDNVGSAETNKTLSMNRAKSVMNAISAKGISASRLSSLGWGQEKPVADNRTEEGKAKNRRVEIVKK